MTIMKIIDGLYFTIGMILFNPLTGEGKTPDQLNEDDRTTYDACMGAIALLKAQEPVEPYTKRDGRTTFFLCGGCNKPLCIAKDSYKPKHCPECGQAVKWNVEAGT